MLEGGILDFLDIVTLDFLNASRAILTKAICRTRKKFTDLGLRLNIQIQRGWNR